MWCVTAQLSDPLHVWKSIKEHSRAVCVRLQLCLPSALSDTVYLLHSPPVLTFPLGFTLAQPHKLRQEAGGGGLYCHTNKHMHNQDPERVQWESRCHFSHVTLMVAWRVNVLIIFFQPPPTSLVFLGLFTWTGGKTVSLVLPLNHQNTRGPLKRPFHEDYWYLQLSPSRLTNLKLDKNVHCCHCYRFKFSRGPATLVSVIICRTGITDITATKTTFSFSGNMEKQSHVRPCFHIWLNIISHDKLPRQGKKTTRKTSTQQNPAAGKAYFLPPWM